MLSTADLDGMRATVALTLTDTATIQRPSRASDGAGGFTTTWGTVASTSCRVVPAGSSPQEMVFAEKVRPKALFRITLPHDADVRVGDRIVMGSVTYEVVGVLAPRTVQIDVVVLAVKVE